MSDQTPVQPIDAEEHATDAPIVSLSPGIQPIEVYSATGRLLTVQAVTEPTLKDNLISEGCVGQLGRHWVPANADVFLNRVRGNEIELIGEVELRYFTPQNSKETRITAFLVMRNLGADIILGKEECAYVAEGRPKGLYPVDKAKQTEEQKKEQDLAKRKNREKSLQVEAEQREAKWRKYNDKDPDSGKDAGGNKSVV